MIHTDFVLVLTYRASACGFFQVYTQNSISARVIISTQLSLAKALAQFIITNSFMTEQAKSL